MMAQVTGRSSRMAFVLPPQPRLVTDMCQTKFEDISMNVRVRGIESLQDFALY